MEKSFLISGVIGWDIEFRDVFNFFNDNSDADQYRMVVNTNGGSVDEGKAIYDLVKSQPKKVIMEVHQAHSIGSVVVQGGDEILMHPNGGMLIHLPWTNPGPINENDLEALKERFSNAKASILDIYVAETGRNRAELEALMGEEKTLSAEEAIKLGFATGYIKEVKEMAAFKGEPIFALNRNQLNNNMSVLSDIRNEISQLKDKLTGAVKNLVISIDTGVQLEIQSGTDDMPQEGHPVLIDGKTAKDGQYVAAENGYIYTVENGKISNIEKPELIEAKEVSEMFAEMKGLHEEVCSQLNEATGIINRLEGELKIAKDEIAALKKGMASNYVAPQGHDQGKDEEYQLYSGWIARKKEIQNGTKNQTR